MTDEKRQKAREKVLSYLRDQNRDYRSDLQPDVAFNWAADEIERLITEVRQLERDLQWTRERYAMAEYSKL